MIFWQAFKLTHCPGQLRERGVTHRQIAREVGVSPVLVTNWAKGMVAPSAGQLMALQNLLQDD